MRVLPLVALALFAVCRGISAQELDPDPNRIFVTQLKWKALPGLQGEEKLKSATGTLVILYTEGVYAEVTASFIDRGAKQQIGLNLNDGFVVRLGKWNRVEDSDLIRIESREMLRSPAGNAKLDGTLTVRTCRLERPSPIHIADTIVCDGLVVDHARKPIDLGGFPSKVRQLVAAPNEADGVSHH